MQPCSQQVAVKSCRALQGPAGSAWMCRQAARLECSGGMPQHCTGQAGVMTLIRQRFSSLVDLELLRPAAVQKILQDGLLDAAVLVPVAQQHASSISSGALKLLLRIVLHAAVFLLRLYSRTGEKQASQRQAQLSADQRCWCSSKHGSTQTIVILTPDLSLPWLPQL